MQGHAHSVLQAATLVVMEMFKGKQFQMSVRQQIFRKGKNQNIQHTNHSGKGGLASTYVYLKPVEQPTKARKQVLRIN